MNEDEDTVEPQVDAVEQMEQPEVDHEAPQEELPIADKQVPLSALQKERKKRQELELELQWERKRQAPVEQPIEDNSKYESATKADLTFTHQQVIRDVEERMWMRNNPEKYEKINEYLPQFLKQRPNLASAINSAPNRYEEAYTLMEALTPKQQQALTKAPVPKKEAPGSPTGVPKAAAMNQAIDVMSMSDSEFATWRQSQKRRR